MRTRYRSILIICLAFRVINVIAFVLNLGVLEWKGATRVVVFFSLFRIS